MAHNNFGAYGYGDGSSYGNDSANTDNHYGWSNWSSSDNSGQQNYQQGQNSYDNYGYSQAQGYTSFSGANFNNFGTFPQKSRQGLGFNSALGPEWSQKHFGSPAGQGKKQKNVNNGPQQGYRMPPQQPKPKTIVTAGKTPTSVLHELFNNITEDYVESGTTPKTYICKLNVDGQTFTGESTNKKSAKHKCSEVALQNLRPDLHIEPFVESVKAAPVKKVEQPQANAEVSPTAKKQKRSAPAAKSEEVKKQKLSPIEAAASLFDLMNRIIADSSEKYVPVFEIVEELPIQPKEEIKEEPMEGEESATPKKEKKVPKWFKDPATIFTVTLKFEEQGKQYQKVGTGRGTQRTLVIREALVDLFNVSMKDIKAVTLRGATQRLHHFSNVSTLYTIASTLGCTVNFDIDLSEAKPLGEGKPFYFAKCKVTSNDDPEKSAEFKSSDSLSKTIAKEQVALLALTQFFELDPSKCKKKNEPVASLGPAATLHTYLQQQGKSSEIKIDYEFHDVEPKTSTPSFSCDCVIGEKRFTAIGSSKKLAKNNVAIIALKELFSVEYDPQASEEAVQKAATEHNVSALCRDIAEFAKREYHGMCGHYNVRPSNQVACFFLVNEKEEKRLISTGSSMQNIVDTTKLDGAMGQTLVHMDAIVLARRSLLRYFIQELAVLETDPENSIFVVNKGKKADLKPNLKLLLYSNFPPVCNMSVRDAKIKKLAYVTPINFTPVPDDVMTSAKIRESKEIRVHCTADKLYKWNTVGLQGGLLSNLLNTIKLDAIFFGTDAPVSDDSLKFALSGRLNENTKDLQLESIATQMRVVTSYSHGWTRGIDSVEKLDHTTGVTHDGLPSKYSKAALFDSYLKLQNSDKATTNYSAAKQKGAAYLKSKKAFYNKLEKAGLGKWQTKPSDFLDNFSIALE